MIMKPQLWNTKLDCGHWRLTNMAFLVKNYGKPKKGEDSYCRQCCCNTKVIDVKKATITEQKVSQVYVDYIGSIIRKNGKRRK